MTQLAMSRFEILVVANIAAIAPIDRVVFAQGNPLWFVAKLQAVLEDFSLACLMDSRAHNLGENADLKGKLWLKAPHGVGEMKFGIKGQMQHG